MQMNWHVLYLGKSSADFSNEVSACCPQIAQLGLLTSSEDCYNYKYVYNSMFISTSLEISRSHNKCNFVKNALMFY